jgi:hypothetical protein
MCWVSFDIEGDSETRLVLIGAYRPYDGQPYDPKAEKFDKELKELWYSFPDTWTKIMLGDLNAQLGRSIPGVTGKYTVRRETKGKHGKSLVQLMRDCKMFACYNDIIY